MTNQAIMIQILHEVTGKPKEDWRRILTNARAIYPELGKGFDRERPTTEAQELLQSLRKEKAGILAWLVEGAIEANLERMPTNGPAH